MNWFSVLVCWCLRLIADSMHLLDGQAGVKTLLLHEAWLRSGERWSSDGSNTSRCARTRSRNSEATSTGYGLAGEDFQNRGTFIVVRSSVFVLCSVHKAQLARDAHNALWNSRRPGQVRKYSLTASALRTINPLSSGSGIH